MIYTSIIWELIISPISSVIDYRHSHASLMLKHGTHPRIVQERQGHVTTATLATYSHIAPGLQGVATERFDNLINEKVIPKINTLGGINE